MPAHNVNVKLIFSLMNIQWTDERSRMDVTTVEAIILQCLVNINMSCFEFHKFIINQKELLQNAKKNEKYN